MCGCGRRRASIQKWIVMYPDGTSEPKNSEVGAKLAAARVSGATYKQV